MQTKKRALKYKYCQHCASYYAGVQHCGVIDKDENRDMCALPDEVIERFKGEYGLERRPIRPPLKEKKD